MNEIQIILKTWIDLIKLEKLQNVIEELKINIHSQNSKISSKDAFKLLLYVSHTASKCNKQNYEIGKQISELTSLLCSIISHRIMDNEKFGLSLFHITRCLLTMHLYSEAKHVCSYVLQDSFECSESKINEIFLQLIHLWHSAADKKFISLQEKPHYIENYYEFKNIVESQLQLIRKVYNNNANHILTKIDMYLRKLLMLKEKPNKYIDDFSLYIFQYQKYKNMIVYDNDKYQVYHLIIRIISRMICAKIYEGNMNYITNILEDASKCFKDIILIEKECCRSFLNFKDICIALLTPVKDLTELTAISIQNYTSQYIKIAKQYGYENTITCTASTFVQIFEYLFLYWENNLQLGNKQFLNTNTLFETMNFLVLIGETLKNVVLVMCTCNEKQCKIKKDLYNDTVLKARCVSLVSKLSAKDLPKNVCEVSQTFMEQSISSIQSMKENNCKHWTSLWSMCGRLLYNMGIVSESFYDKCSFFISLLCSSIIYFEGINSESSYLKLPNPICTALYRLSSIHYTNGMYREAMTVSALHGLLSYKDINSKAFRMWATIKHKASKTSPNLTKVSMISCLTTDMSKIEEIGLYINLSDYNLIELCLSEAKGLQAAKINLVEAFDSVLHELKMLKATTVQKACVIQLLGYHLLHVPGNYISDYFKNIVNDLESLKHKSIYVLCLKANLEFFTFVNELNISRNHVEEEMESTKFALQAPKLSENPGSYVVPAYTKINIKEDIRLMQLLEKPLETWGNIEQNIVDMNQSWEPLLSLRILIVIAEYSRLYRYEECESKAWSLAIKLALKLQNYDALIYVTGRSLSLRQVNFKWIALAKEYAVNLKNSANENTIHAIAVFWISLADFYFECSKHTEAIKLLDDARCLPGISFHNNIAVYLYSLVTILHNSHLYKKDMEQEEYISYIVESLYAMISLKDCLDVTKWMYPDKYLFSYDILFSSTVNMSLKVNSLLSSKEIIAHLIQRLKAAQSLSATIRTVEILKSLCFIDLSRSQLDDCEVKLQGLEHILDIETIKLSMNTKLKQTSECLTPLNHIIDPIRATVQNDTSPVLRRKVFNLPDFLLHHNCTCLLCQHTQYQYLVFACTHIRAQLYALQNQITAALEHFHGAFQIRQNLFKVEKTVLPKNCLEETDKIVKFSWQTRFYIIDYVLLLLHFSYFLNSHIPSKRNEAINVALVAVDVCKAHNVENHPIYISVKELVYENYFEKIMTDHEYATFTVPHINDINISKFMPQESVEQEICHTPVTHNSNLKKPFSIRRNKTPQVLKLKQISINLSDEDESDSPTEISNQEISVFHTKVIRRKISEEEYSENINKQTEKGQLTSIDTERTEDISIKNIITKVASSVPDISDHLYKIADNLEIPATNESIKQLFEMVENLKIKTHISRNKNKSDSKKSLSDTRVKDAIALFKQMVISEVAFNDNTSKTNTTIPKIIIDDTEANAITHISKPVPNVLAKEKNSSEINKPCTRVTRSTRSTKSATVNKTKTALRQRPNIR